MFTRMYKCIVACCVVMIVSGGFVANGMAQTAEFKIGFVDLQKVINASAQGKRVQEDIQKRADELSSQADRRKQELEALKADYEKQAEMLTTDARREKQDVIAKMEVDLSRFVQDSQAELRTAEQRGLKQLLADIGKVVVEYGKTNGYTVILEAGGILYGAESIEVTDEIIARYNSRK